MNDTILLLSEIFPPRTGGSGRWFWEIYRRLPRASVVIAAGEHEHQDEFDRTHDLRVVRIPLTMQSRALRSLAGLRGYGRGLRRLWPLMQRERVGVIHCGRCLPEGLMALALQTWYRVPFICYVHGEEISVASTSRELTWLARKVLHAARFLIANSRNTALALKEEWGLPAGRIQLLHPGVDTRWFVPADRDPQVRDALGWTDRPVILTVGRLQKRKGQDQLIRALPAIRQVVPDVLYSIVGDGEERPILEALCGQTGMIDHVQFLGEMTDDRVRECFQQCDLFVLPNRAVGKDIEGFGMVLLEAQACGKPVIAGASGGTAETMRIPETGRIVSCDGPEVLAGVIAELLGDPQQRDRMGQAGRSWVVENFDWLPLSRQAAKLFHVDALP